MEFLEKVLKKSGWFSILTSVIFAILGIILVWKPIETVRIISYILGTVFIVVGLVKIVNYFIARGKYDFYNYDLIFGLMAVVIGVVTIVCSDTIGAIFRIIIGIWIIYSALVRFNLSLKLRAINSSVWLYSLLLATLILICGLYIALNVGSLVMTIGVVMIIYSIIDIAEDVIFMKNVKDLF